VRVVREKVRNGYSQTIDGYLVTKEEEARQEKPHKDEIISESLVQHEYNIPKEMHHYFIVINRNTRFLQYSHYCQSRCRFRQSGSDCA